MNKAIVYLIYFTIYTFILLWFGKSEFKKTNNIRDFYVAENNLGLTASIFTFTATWFSAASMQGLSGSMYAYGYVTILYAVVPWFLGAAFLVLLAWKLKDYDILTIPEYFKIRYESKGLQALGGAIIVVSYILYIIIQIRGFGIVMSELLDINYTLAIFLVYLFIVYTTFGGLYSVTKTDGLNFILIILGTLLAAGIILKNIGGISSMHEKAAIISTRPFPNFPYPTPKGGLLDPFSKGAYSPLLIFTTFFGWGLGLAANPQYATRITSAKSKKTATKMVCYSVLILAIIYIGMIIIGIGSRVLQPSIAGIDSVDEVFPFVINNIIYSPLSGFILISIAAAAISTANSQLLILASGFCYDIYINLIDSKIDEDRFLNLNRLFIVCAGSISLLLSIKPPISLLVYGGYVWGGFAASFLLPLYGGLFWKKATKQGALASMIGGIITIVILVIRFEFINLTNNYVIHPAFPGVMVSAILFFTVSKATYIKNR